MKIIPPRLSTLRLLVCMTALSWNISHAAQTKPAPKLIVTIVVDGLPQEQVMRYRAQFGEGGFKRLLEHGAWYGNAHQAHGVTVTAVGHAAVLTGAYPYQHSIIANEWVDTQTRNTVYCTEDRAHTYLGEETKQGAGTSPANLRVSTVGDELRYATGNLAKVITVSGKDRGAILLAGKAGTAYMYMGKSGRFASSTYYMNSHPEWVQRYHASSPQDRYYGQEWKPLLDSTAYAGDAPDDLIAPKDLRLPYKYDSPAGKPDADYYGKLYVGPYLDQMTLNFAQAAIEGENLGKNGATDILGISLSSHDYINHKYGPESRMSHDHIQRLDRMLAGFFDYLDQRVGLDNTLVLLTADHGFPNTPEFAHHIKRDAARLDSKKMMVALNTHLQGVYGAEKLAEKWSGPNVLLDYPAIAQKGLQRAEVEATAARFLLAYPGVANTYTRTQLEQGLAPNTRLAMLMQRAWHRQISGDIMLVLKPYWYFGSGSGGTSHGSPYTYDTNVPLMIMGRHWIKPGQVAHYAEVVDIAPTLAHLLNIRPPSAAEGRVLSEMLE